MLDEKNRPSIGTPVRVLRWMIQSGDRTLVSAGSGTTDDRGLYRVYNLAPGDYLVSAVPRNSSGVIVEQVQRADELRALGLAGELSITATISGTPPANADPATGYAPVYFPGTTDLAAAGSVRLGIAEEQLGIDVPLYRVALSAVSGHVIVPGGQNPSTVQVRLLRREGSAIGVGATSARPSQNGSFTIRSVVPGHYVVFATSTAVISNTGLPNVPQPPGMPPGPVSQRLWAQADVFVDGSYPPVVQLTMEEGRPVSGHLVFDGSASLPQGNQRVRVTMAPLGQPLQSAGLGNMTATADHSGRFTIPGVVPGRYRVTATGAPGWQVKSVIVNGVDVLDFPFVVEPSGSPPDVSIRLGDRHTDLRGRLTDSSGAPTADYSVVIFADDPRYWIPFARRMRAVRPNTEGVFSFSGLPPGDYRLAAVTDVDTGEWFDPEFLRQLVPASIGVRLADGQSTTQDIRVR